MALGERIRRLRELRGMNPSELAGQAGITRQTLANLEDDGPKQNPRLDTLRKLASVLEVSVAYLIGEGYPIPESLRSLALENGISYKDLDPLLLMTFDDKESTTEEEWKHLLSSFKDFPGLYKRMGRMKDNSQKNGPH